MPPSVSPFFRKLAINLGDFRPIVTDYSLLRLTANCVNSDLLSVLKEAFASSQLGASVSGVCEAAIHAGRQEHA